MRRVLLRLGLGSSALGALALVGCHGEMLAPRSPTVRSASVAVLEKPEPCAPALRSLEGGTVPKSYRLLSAVEASREPSPPDLVLARARKRRVEPIVVCKVEWQGPGEGRRDSCAQEVAARLAPPVRREAIRPSAQRPTAIPITSFSFSQPAGPDGGLVYLVGYLVRRPHGGWSVRCMPAERGASPEGLALLNPGPMAGFHSGQRVRVEGQLVDPGPHELAPSYAVRAIQSLRPEAGGPSGDGGGHRAAGPFSGSCSREAGQRAE